MASSSGVIAVNAPAMSLVSSGSHEGSLKGKGTKTTTRWSGLFGSTYKVRISHPRDNNLSLYFVVSHAMVNFLVDL